ncbi:MAG: cytosine permease [Actinobacteria bacterium]|nr:cytosine permease [Actinomycetota bacterium]
MASVTERLEEILEREAPAWGIRPVPPGLRRLGAGDLAVLWGDLSIGLLVLVSGALLVPALAPPAALLAIVVGSLVGCVPLALVGLAGTREGVPGMVLFRPVLGVRGSFLPSAVNLVQLIGWTGFEFWAMGRVANAVGRDLFGVGSYTLWVAVVAVVCTALALAGPVFAVRRWLERFGFWVVLAVAVWVSFRVVTAGQLGAIWRLPGRGGLPFWAAVDLVIAMPISWLPLVADYNRFGRGGGRSFAGTFWSYAVGNVWFYALGALLVLAAGSAPDVLDIGTKIAALAGGAVVLLALLVGESDQAMANIYSSAVSAQNVRPELSQRWLIVAVGAVGFALAALIRNSAATFEYFLFLIGSVFVPLFGVFAADYFVLRRGRYGEAEMFEGAAPGFRTRALAPWLAGFVMYQWCLPTGPAWWVGALGRAFDALHLPLPLIGGSAVGGSAPSFLVAFGLSLAVLRRRR